MGAHRCGEISLSGLTVEEVRESVLPRGLRLFRQIAERVLNDYVEAVAELRLASAECGTTRLALNAAATRLLARARAHHALQPPASGGEEELGGYLERVCAALSTARLEEHQTWLTLSADEVWLDVYRCWLVGLLVAELIDDSACFVPPGAHAAVRVQVVSDGRRLIGAVVDPRRAPVGKGTGPRLVETLAAELGTTVERTSAGQGCCARFELPIETPRPDLAARSRGRRRRRAIGTAEPVLRPFSDGE
jgi:two-component sensor histidine kinase